MFVLVYIRGETSLEGTVLDERRNFKAAVHRQRGKEWQREKQRKGEEARVKKKILISDFL